MDKSKQKLIEIEMLIYSLGYLNALKSEIIELNKRDRLFTVSPPYYKVRIISWLEKHKFEQGFVDLIYSIIELEDIWSIVPSIFNETIDKLIEQVTDNLKIYMENFECIDLMLEKTLLNQ